LGLQATCLPYETTEKSTPIERDHIGSFRGGLYGRKSGEEPISVDSEIRIGNKAYHIT